MWTIYKQLRKHYIGGLFDLTLVMQQGDTTVDVTELEEPIVISFEIPEEMRYDGRHYIIYRLQDDGNYYDPTVIRPISYDEATGRLTFETDKIKPFIVGYTYDPNEGDVIIFEEDDFDDDAYVLEIKLDDYTPITTPTVVSQLNVVQPKIEDTRVLKADNYQVSGDTTIKLPSAKTGDSIKDFVLSFFISFGRGIM